jgi:hypothetical protein
MLQIDLFTSVIRAAVISIAVLLGQTLMTPVSADPPMATVNWHSRGEGTCTRVSAKPMRMSLSDGVVKQKTRSASPASPKPSPPRRFFS